MANKHVVYTGIFGGYDDLKDPIKTCDSVDYICFTDDSGIKSEKWDVRVIKPFVPGDSIRSARYVKICAHKFLPEYDCSLYIDGHMTLKTAVNVMNVLRGSKFAMSRHTGRDCVYAEASICKVLGKGDPDDIDRQIRDYGLSGYPAHNGLYGSGLHAKMHNDPEVIERCETWWEHVKKYSVRDQISFPYVFDGFPVEAIPIELYYSLVRQTGHLK